MLAMYRAIWRLTLRRQLFLIVLSVALAGLAAVPLELQKDIINHVVGEQDFSVLLWLTLGYLAVTALSAGLKFAVEYTSGALGEAVIREIRGRIYGALVRSKTADVHGPETGTSVTMISAEAEQIGSFAGEAIANPLVRIGTLLTVITYIAAQSWILGAITAAVVIPQGLIALLTQSSINARVKARVAALRDGTDRIARSDLTEIEAETTDCFDRIFEARCAIFRIKLSTKFAMNLLTGLGTATILLLGGQRVMEGAIDVGTITVALTALTRTVQPWRELVMFYRKASMVRVRFEILRTTFPEEVRQG